VTQRGAGPTCQHRGQVTAGGRDSRHADRVDTSVHRMQKPRDHTSGDRGAVQPDAAQLRHRDHPMLACGERRHRPPNRKWAVLVSIYAITTAHLARVALGACREGGLCDECVTTGRAGRKARRAPGRALGPECGARGAAVKARRAPGRALGPGCGARGAAVKARRAGRAGRRPARPSRVRPGRPPERRFRPPERRFRVPEWCSRPPAGRSRPPEWRSR
jgi:hypothetical protein